MLLHCWEICVMVYAGDGYFVLSTKAFASSYNLVDGVLH